MKKLFFIIASYSKGGGAEALLTTIVNNLDKEKYEIGIMEIVHAYVKQEKVDENVTIFPYYVSEDDPQRRSKLYYVYHDWDKVISEYVPQDYDVYISFNYLRPTFLLPPGKKNIAWIHSDVYDLAQERLKEERELQDLAFGKVQKIVSISDITTQSLIDLFPNHQEKLVEIYNGLDIESVRYRAKEKTDTVLQHPAIVVTGRLVDRKHPDRAVDVLNILHKNGTKAHLYYLGYGKLEAEIDRKVEEYGLDLYVHKLGYLENPFPVMKQADISCMFSECEGFPLVLLESVALGVPFVSTCIGGARILANGQTCGSVIETDEQAANAINDWLNKEKSDVVDKCNVSIQRFALDKYIKAIENLIDSVLNKS